MKTKGRGKPWLVRVLAVLLSFAFALSGIPVTSIAEAEAEAEAFAQQELLSEENNDAVDLETEPTDTEGEWVDTEGEDDFGPVDEAAEEAVTVADFAAQVAENAGEGAGEAALAEAAYDLMVTAVVPVGDAEDVAAEDVLAGKPADALSIARALCDVLTELGIESDVLVADADGSVAWTVAKVDGAWLHLDVAQGARELADDEAEPWRLLADEELLARDAARSPWHALDGVWEPTAEGEPEAEVVAETEAEPVQEAETTEKPEVEALAGSAYYGTPSSTEISLNKSYSGSITPYTQSAYYKFTLPAKTNVTITGTFDFDVSSSPYVFAGLMSSGSTAPTSAFSSDPCTTSWREHYYADKYYLDVDMRKLDGASVLKLSDAGTYSIYTGHDTFKSITLPKGTYYFLVQWDSSCGSGSYDSVDYTFRVSTPNRDISTSRCTATIKTQAWTGKQIKPTPTVKWGGTTLRKGVDFKIVQYGTNKNNGTKGNWVKIQGIGSYKGTRKKAFRIRKPNVLYYVHRQTYGWEKAYSKRNGQQSGTTGQSKRLEGIYIKLSNKPVTGSIQYRTHVQKIGWQGWRSAGHMSGTKGRALRLEAIQIKLTGNMAKKYNVWYRVHAQHFGWMGWAKNGERSGTAGYAYRLESIQIVLKPKGTSAPPATFMGARRATAAAFKDKNALKYKFKRDTWNFHNYSTYIPLEYHQRMFGNAMGRELYYDTDYGYAGGVCYGFSTTVAAMVKHKYPTIRSFGASSVYGISKYDYTSSLKMYADDYIEYGYLTQYDYRLLNEMYNTKNNYSGLVNAVKKHQKGGTAIEIDLMGSRGGHSVFPIKVSTNNSSKTVIDIYDNNHPTELQKLTLWKSGGRYYDFSYSDNYYYTWVAWETPADNFKSFMAGNGIYKGAASDMNLISTDTDLTVVSGGKEYRLSPDNTSDLDMVVPVLSKGGTTTKQLYWVGFDTSDMVVKGLSKNANITVTTKTGGVEVNAKKGSTLHMNVSDTAKNSVSIDGKKGDDFKVTYREDNGKDLDEYEVKGTATGEVVETTLEDTGKVDVKGGTLK